MTTRSRFGGDQPADFLMLAIDGMQARLDSFQTSLDALRRTAEAMLDSHQPRYAEKPPRRVLALPEAVVPAEPPKPSRATKNKSVWATMTATERSVEMKRRMAVARQNAATTLKSKNLKASWTPERRAAAAAEARRRWKAGVYAAKATHKRNA